LTLVTTISELKKRAVDSSGRADSTPAQFNWTINENAGPTLENESLTAGASRTAEQLGETSINQAKQQQQQEKANDLTLAQKALEASVKANALNPPFLSCPRGASEATYYIEGQASSKDLRNILVNNPSSELGLVLYVDLRQLPEDIDNQIINTNNLYIKAQLVGNPNDITMQRTVPYDVIRIYTSCQTTPFFDGKKIINEGTAKKNSLTTATAIQREINPPFGTCTLTGNNRTSTGVTLPVQGRNADGTTNNSRSIVQIPFDYAKHTIVGKIKGTISQNVGGKQLVTFVIHNVMTFANPAANPTSVQGNNNQIAGDIIINPGQTSGTSLIKETITRISTGCQEVPFVADPRSIGTREVTFAS